VGTTPILNTEAKVEMRAEVKAALAYVLRGRIQNLEERDPHKDQALLARLVLLKEGLGDLEQVDTAPSSSQKAGTLEETEMTNMGMVDWGPLYTGGEI